MTASFGGRRGQSAIMYTLAATMMFGALGLVVDIGWAYYRKQVLQTAADAAAIAAGLYAYKAAGNAAPGCGVSGVQCATEVVCPSNTVTASNNIQAGCMYAQANGAPPGPKIQVTFQSGVGGSPTATGVAISYWVVARVTERVPQLFSAVLGKPEMVVSARATTGVREASSGGCVYVLNPTVAEALRITGTANLSSGCGVFVNSNNPSAIVATGGGTIATTGAARTHIVGNWDGSGTITPAPITGVSSGTDPFEDMAPPDVAECQNSVNLGSHDQLTIRPETHGVMCGGINLTSQAQLTLQPGVYVIKNGINLGGQSSLTGNGVTLYIQSGGVTMAGGASVNLTAPSSGEWQGILMFQDRSNTSPATLVGGTNQAMNGVLYFPAAHVSYTGGSSTEATQTTIVSNTLELVGNSLISAAATTQYTGITGGVFLVE